MKSLYKKKKDIGTMRSHFQTPTAKKRFADFVNVIDMSMISS